MPQGMKGPSGPGSNPDPSVSEGRSCTQRDLWLECADETRLHALRWIPSEPARATVIYLHGLGAHAGWGGNLAAYLSDQGFDVLAPDMRGHGRTEGGQGHLPGPATLISDVLRWLERIRSAEVVGAHPVADAGIFLTGTSLGGCLAAAVAESVGRGRLCGVALFSPAFQPIYLSWQEQLSMFLRLLAARDGMVPTPLARGLRITSDDRVIEALRADSLSLNGLTVRSHWNASRLIQRARWNLNRLVPPLLVAQGARDPVVSSLANQKLFRRRPGTDFLWLPDAFHDLPLEPLHTWAGALIGWMNSRLRGAAL